MADDELPVAGDDPLSTVYDDVELARIDRPAQPPREVGPVQPVPRYPVARRMGIAGGILAGAMAGLAEVLEPEPDRTHQIEFAPDGVDPETQPVTYLHVPGDPRASRLVIRPWLFARR